MDEIKGIGKRYFEEGVSIKRIAQETCRDRKTIRKQIDKQDWNINKKAPKQSASKIGPYKPIIDKWLENDKQQHILQRHTAKRVHVRLLEEYKDTGYDCSYRTVASYVSLKSQIYSGKKGYLPLEHSPGEAQVDFGSADFIEHGIRYSGCYLTVSFPYSNTGFIQLLKR